MASSFRVYPRPEVVPYAEQIMSRLHLSPQKLDEFCRNVLSEIAVYQQAATAHSIKDIHEKFGKSAPAISQKLKKLELDLAEWLNGGAIRDPTFPKSIEITEAGRLLLEFAEKVLGDSAAFLESLNDIQHDTQVRLACIHSAYMAYGPNLEKEFAKRLPGGSIAFQNIGGANYPEAIAAAVLEGRADLGITSYPPKVEPPLVLQRFLDRKLVLVFSARYKPLPRKREPVDLEDVIRHDDEVKIAVHKRGSDSPLGNAVVYYLKRHGAYLQPSQLREGENIAEIKSSIQRFPNTIGILPEDCVADEVAEGGLVSYDLEPALKPWTWGLICKSGTPKPSVIAFIECLRPLFKAPIHKMLRAS